MHFSSFNNLYLVVRVPSRECVVCVLFGSQMQPERFRSCGLSWLSLLMKIMIGLWRKKSEEGRWRNVNFGFNQLRWVGKFALFQFSLVGWMQLHQSHCFEWGEKKSEIRIYGRMDRHLRWAQLALSIDADDDSDWGAEDHITICV